MQIVVTYLVRQYARNGMYDRHGILLFVKAINVCFLIE